MEETLFEAGLDSRRGELIRDDSDPQQSTDLVSQADLGRGKRKRKPSRPTVSLLEQQSMKQRRVIGCMVRKFQSANNGMIFVAAFGSRLINVVGDAERCAYIPFFPNVHHMMSCNKLGKCRAAMSPASNISAALENRRHSRRFLERRSYVIRVVRSTGGLPSFDYVIGAPDLGVSLAPRAALDFSLRARS